MANYASWNTAIIRFFTANVPRGASVFLTLNDDALQEIAANFLVGEVSPQAAGEEFIQAVRAQAVRSNAVSLTSVTRAISGPFPKGIGFLSLMVLAAHRMDNDEAEGINETNYFRRLTQLLGVPPGIGNRPAGLGTGHEEPLWTEWNKWLQRHGWQPTARPGPEGTRKYLNYVLTQALVRDGDKSHLQSKFILNSGAGGISRSMDEVQLAGWLQRTNAITRRYLREGFRNSDSRRAAAFYEAAYRVYEATNWEGGPDNAVVQRSRVINAGLTRSVSLGGQVKYRLFVPQPTNWVPKPLQINPAGASASRLLTGRPGHFEPLWIQTPFVKEPLRMKLNGDTLLDAVVFPSRDFWIFTSDPEDPTGAFATWEKFPNLLGQKFMLICSTEGEQFVQDEMDKFRDAGLINWDSGPQAIHDQPIHEYRGCMILSSAWDGVVPSDECAGLYEALKPKQFATISLSGGIRAPGQNAWLVGHPPKATIYGFEEEFCLRLFSGEEQKFERLQRRQEVCDLDLDMPPGIYALEIDWNGQRLATRSFRLINWMELEAIEPETDIVLEIRADARQLRISGALIEEHVIHGEGVQNA